MDVSTPAAVPEEALIHPGEVVAVVDQKGGVGKTTTAGSIASELAAAGVSVTMIDADEQDGSLSGWFPPQWDDVPLEEQYDLYHVLTEQVPFNEALWPVNLEGPARILPSFKSVKQFEDADMPGKDTILRDVMEESSDRSAITIMDCGPHLRQVTATALVAADAVIIPVKVGGLDFKGMRELDNTLSRIRRRLSKHQRTAAVLTTMANPNLKLTGKVESRLREDYPEAYHTRISITGKVGEAQFAEEPLRTFEPRGTVTREYADLTRALFAPVLEAARG